MAVSAAGGGAENNDKLGSTRQGTGVQWHIRIASSDFFCKPSKDRKVEFSSKKYKIECNIEHLSEKLRNK